MITTTSGEFQDFPWCFTFQLWKMHNLRTCICWQTWIAGEAKGGIGEDREWLKKN